MGNFVSSENSNYDLLLSGGSGVLGSTLAESLMQRGRRVLRLVRRPPNQADELRWDPSNADNPVDARLLPRLAGIKAAVHLSGANVAAHRWTAAYKEEIRTSRVETTIALSRLLAGLAEPPEVLVSASAIGYYGDRAEEILTENSAAGAGFFPDLCREWEQASRAAVNAKIRVVHPRFGVVLSSKGGALEQMKQLFQLGLGGRLGSGKQWMSWISEADAIASVRYALDDRAMAGAYNAVAPEPVTNAEFTQQLADAMHRPAFMAAPAFALRLAFGEMADEALLASTRAIPSKLNESEFVFSHRTLSTALRAALG